VIGFQEAASTIATSAASLRTHVNLIRARWQKSYTEMEGKVSIDPSQVTEVRARTPAQLRLHSDGLHGDIQTRSLSCRPGRGPRPTERI
jgi:hypothetical protein